MNDPKNFFFKSPTSSVIDSSKYKEIELLTKMCDVVSSINNQSVYFFDYTQQTFFHISPHPLFLCGYDAEEAKKMGAYFFYKKILPPDDFQMLFEINKKAWKFVYDCIPEDRWHFRVSYDIYLQHKNGNRILVNQKVAPLLFTDDGNIWMSMCIVNYSSHKNAGNVIFHQKDKDLYYKYDFDKKIFTPYLPEKLTKREDEILRLSMQGYNETGISDKLNLSVRTIRNHQYNAKKKLGVSNLANAVGEFNLIF